MCFDVGEGLRPLILSKCQSKVKIPMIGHHLSNGVQRSMFNNPLRSHIDSLNASVATGIVLHQIFSSRTKEY